MLNLGPRLSEQEYSSDDRKLLDNLAAQAAPALRVGQLVRQQQAEAATRQRFEQELEVAKLIQQNFLPKQLPGAARAGRSPPTTGRRARSAATSTTSSRCPTGKVGFVVGDVTDKGVPAALVMAATRSVLRASAQRLVDPGEMLERVNEHLCPDMPEKMFVTCLYGVLDPETGHFRFANAGHDLPYVKTADGSEELRARGMPLGLMPGMPYEEKETVLQPGDSLLLHSDGIVEAHSPDREMFGFPRLKQCVADYPGGGELIDRVLADLHAFTGPDAEQEDDITHGHAPALARRGPHGQRRRAGRGRCSPSSRSRAPRATSAWRSSAWRAAVAGLGIADEPARAPEDRGRRGDDERDGARQRATARTARSASACSPATAACACRSPTSAARRPRPSARCPTSRPSSRACSARAAGASS